MASPRFLVGSIGLRMPCWEGDPRGERLPSFECARTDAHRGGFPDLDSMFPIREPTTRGSIGTAVVVVVTRRVNLEAAVVVRAVVAGGVVRMVVVDGVVV